MPDCWLDTEASAVFPAEAQYLRQSPAYSGASRPKAFVAHGAVQTGDILTVAIEQERRSALACADNLLACLAPAWVRDFRIHVRPETILRRLQRLPHAFRTLLGEAEADDRLD